MVSQILVWKLCSGSMEFVVPAADPSVFFPISVRFTAARTFSDLKVCSSLYMMLCNNHFQPIFRIICQIKISTEPPVDYINLLIFCNCILPLTSISFLEWPLWITFPFNVIIFSLMTKITLLIGGAMILAQNDVSSWYGVLF